MKKFAYFILAIFFSLFVFFFVSSSIFADDIPFGVKPIKVTALSQELDILGKVQFVLTFWNVGQLSDNSAYHEAVLSGKCFDEPGADGWKCVGDKEENSGKGTFTGGPNGTFMISDKIIHLKNGKTATYLEGGQEIIFTVQNTDAFKGWDDQIFDEKTAQELGLSDNPEGMLDSSEVSITNIIGDVGVSDPSLRRGLFDQSIKALKTLTGWDKDPEPWRVRVDAKEGMKLKDGFQMKTGEGKAVIQFKDGTKFIMKENSTITFNSTGFNLDMGTTIFNFKKIGKKIYITDKRGKFSIIGTQFEVSTGKDNTLLKVYEGAVETESLGGKDKTMVKASEQIIVTNNGLGNKSALPGEKTINIQAIEKEIIAGEKIQAGKFILIQFGLIIIGILFILGIILFFNKKTIGVVLIVLSIGAGGLILRNQAKQKPVTEKKESVPTAIPITIPAKPTIIPTKIVLNDKETGDWETYKNEEMGFSIQHPSNLKPEDLGGGSIVFQLWGPTQSNDTEFYDGVNISITTKALDGKTLENIVEENRTGSKEVWGNEEVSEKKQTGWGGYNGYMYQVGGHTYYYLIQDSQNYLEIFNLSGDPGNLGYIKTSEKIISSLQKINPTDSKMSPTIIKTYGNLTGKWTGKWTNSLGESSDETLEITDDGAGNFKGV